MSDLALVLGAGLVAAGFGFFAHKALRYTHFKFIKLKRSREFRKEIRKYRYWIPAVILGFLSFPIVTYLFNFGSHSISSSAAEWGQMGDFFGGMLNPILAFASFIALLYTIRIQSEELRLTREEFAKSAEAQKELADEAKRQRAHSLLLLDAQEKAVEAAKNQLLSMEQQRVSDLFLKVLEIIRNSAPIPAFSASDLARISKSDASSIYMSLKLSGLLDVSQPSKIMHLLRYLEQSAITEKDKQLLIDQLRLTITASGAFLLAISLAPNTFNDANSFRAIVKKYKILVSAQLVYTSQGLSISFPTTVATVAIPLTELGLEENDFFSDSK